MTRRLFIYVDNKERKLYVSPEFNGDKSEYAQRGGTLDSCDLTRDELFRLFEVKPSPTSRKPALRRSDASIPTWIGPIPLRDSFQLRR